jgi:hypothetical protein
MIHAKHISQDFDISFDDTSKLKVILPLKSAAAAAFGEIKKVVADDCCQGVVSRLKKAHKVSYGDEKRDRKKRN